MCCEQKCNRPSTGSCRHDTDTLKKRVLPIVIFSGGRNSFKTHFFSFTNLLIFSTRSKTLRTLKLTRRVVLSMRYVRRSLSYRMRCIQKCVFVLGFVIFFDRYFYIDFSYFYNVIYMSAFRYPSLKRHTESNHSSCVVKIALSHRKRRRWKQFFAQVAQKNTTHNREKSIHRDQF